MVRILSKHQILSMTLLISKYLIPFKKQPSLKSPGEVAKIVFYLLLLVQQLLSLKVVNAGGELSPK